VSQIAGCFGLSPDWRAPRVSALLDLIVDSGDEQVETWQEDGAAIGVSRHLWQCDVELEGKIIIAQSEGVVVASDANLYGTDALVEELADATGVPARRASATLILRAYERWGEDCARHLNGDYAFVIWDRRLRRALLGRDLVGRRSLFFRELADGFAVASRATALARGFDPQASVNLALVAAAASALPGGSRQSAYDGVVPVAAGATVAWAPSVGAVTVAQWEAPAFQLHNRTQSFEDAAEQLREVLTEAVRERVSPGRTAVWMSGGADSTAIFAAAMSAADRGHRSSRVQPISVSYPTGDPAREDEHILALAGRWNSTVRWIDSESVSLFDGMEERARLRDDPFAHTFAQMNGILAATTRANGAHVALDGFGGDALFEVSPAYLAELLRAGDLREWWQARHRSAVRGLKSTLRWSVLPALPEWLWRVVDVARREPLNRPIRYPIVGWLTSRARDDVLARGFDWVDLRPRRGEGPAAFEARCGLTGPHFARALALTRSQTVSAGVEVRSPFMDRRLIEFAAGRPVAERGWQGNSKRLLKAAMRGIIPDSILAPRPFKTGIAARYLHRQFATGILHRLRAVFSRSSALADHGIVEPGAVLRAADLYQTDPQHLTGVSLYLTLESELWLRSR